jgi:predicted permease
LNWHAKTFRGDFVMQEMSGDVYDDPKLGSVSGIFPYPAFELFKKNGSTFSNVFAYCQTREVRTMNLTIKGHADLAHGELVSGDYFRGLAIFPAAGRLILPNDDRLGAAAVAVVSDAFSEKHFGGPATAAGQSILINNLPFIVVGVTPPEFFGVDPEAVPDIYLPMHANVLLGAADQFGFRADAYFDRNYYWVEVMARLRPGVTLAQAQAALAPRFQQWVATTANNDRQRANLPALVLKQGASGLDTLRRRFSRPLYVLMTLVGLILALACSNVANLLLARAGSRKREIGLRLSLGADRLRIVRQLLTESILLGSLGGVLGVFFAFWGIRFLSLLLESGPRHVTVHADLNWHVLSVAAALSLLTGVLFGLAPAIQSTGVDVAPALKETRASHRHTRHSFWRISVTQALVVGQIAISLLLLVAAGLFVRTLSNLESVKLGFNRKNVLLFQLNARQAGHHDPEITDFYRNLREISILLSTNQSSGWEFCRKLTNQNRALQPRLLQNAEFWPGEFADIPATVGPVLAEASSGGAGFDVVQHDALRIALRGAVQAASSGMSAALSMTAVAAALYPPNLDHAWRAVTCVENHDLVKAGRQPRIPSLADSSNHRSWYARSRTRVAMAILLTAPGVPQLFMGQEFLEDKPWDENPTGPNLLSWNSLNSGQDRSMSDHLRSHRI